MNQITQAFIVLFHFTENGIDGGAVCEDQFASGGVGEEFFGEASSELAFAFDDVLSEFRNRGESVTIGQFACCIDGQLLTIFITPTTDGIKIFQGKPERINLTMALGAGGNLAVLGQLVTNGQSSADIRLNFRHIIGWWWRCVA